MKNVDEIDFFTRFFNSVLNLKNFILIFIFESVKKLFVSFMNSVFSFAKINSSVRSIFKFVKIKSFVYFIFKFAKIKSFVCFVFKSAEIKPFIRFIFQFARMYSSARFKFKKKLSVPSVRLNITKIKIAPFNFLIKQQKNTLFIVSLKKF